MVVLVQTVELRGRRLISSVVIAGDSIDSGALKSLPIGWIENVVNTPQAAEYLSQMEGGADALAAAINERLDEAFVQELPSTGWVTPTKLTRPDGSDPDAFYQAVAAAYNAAVSESSRVAPRLAEEAGVPVPTVHRWIAEARRRGFLPPARRGRAG